MFALSALPQNEAALQKLLPELAVSQPMIIGVGSSIFSCEYRVIVERQQFFTPPPTTFLDALEWVYAAYFVFNFAYPRELSNTLEYVQRYYVGYNPHIKMVTLANSRPKIANFLKKMKDFERLDWNANNIRVRTTRRDLYFYYIYLMLKRCPVYTFNSALGYILVNHPL